MLRPNKIPGWVIGWCVVASAAVLALVVPQARLPGDEPGIRDFQTPDIAAAAQLSQTFEMTADRFEAVELRPVKTGMVSGIVRFDLSDVTDGVRLMYRVEIPASDLVKGPSYRLEFPPIRESRGRRYRVEVTGPEADAPKGVALLATKGERYAGGTMSVSDRERWADLAFRTFASEGRSRWAMLTAIPSGRGSFVLACLAAYGVLFGVVLQMLWPSTIEPSA